MHVKASDLLKDVSGTRTNIHLTQLILKENALQAADWIGLRISLAAHEGVVNLDEGSRPRVT